MEAAFQAILTCARDNDVVGIRKFLAMGCPPSLGNKMGQTALHIGGIWGSIEAVQVLLEARADPNAQNKLRGSAPLHACAMGRGPIDKRAECAKLLIKGKGDPALKDYSGETPMDAAADDEIRVALGAVPFHLHKAVQTRNKQTLVDCIALVKAKRYTLTMDTPNQLGDTALHLAADMPWCEGATLLLDANAAVHCQNNFRRLPLHNATLKGDHRIVALLLERSAPVNAKDMDPEHNYQSKEEPGPHRTALHYAAQLGNVLNIKLLLDGRSDPNPKDANQCTPLSLCLLLREKGAELEVGGSARIQGVQQRPAWNGRFCSLVGLVQDGAGAAPRRWPVLVEGEDASEAVLLKEGNLQQVPDEILDLLLKARADVNLSSGREMQLPLLEAARTGDTVLTTKCLAAGADVNKSDVKNGFTALHMAARTKHHEVSKLLVQARADVSLTSEAGKTASDLARVNGCPAALLATYGVDVEDATAEVASTSIGAGQKQTLESLTPEQRAQLFLD